MNSTDRANFVARVEMNRVSSRSPEPARGGCPQRFALRGGTCPLREKARRPSGIVRRHGRVEIRRGGAPPRRRAGSADGRSSDGRLHEPRGRRARRLQTGRATFFSRSRRTLWEKGETSGHAIHVREVFVDCDADTCSCSSIRVGPSCHTGQPSCFFRRLDGGRQSATRRVPASTVLAAARARNRGQQEQHGATRATRRACSRPARRESATRCAKRRPSSPRAVAAETRRAGGRAKRPTSSITYWWVSRSRGCRCAQVLDVLARRAGTSGHAEKASREK